MRDEMSTRHVWAARVILLTLALALTGPAQAKVGANSFCNSYVVPPAGTVGIWTAPPATSGPPPNNTTTCPAATTGGGATTTVTALTNVGGSLETNEPLVPLSGKVLTQNNVRPTNQGQTVWFQWTPFQATAATITITSANTNAFQFQPIIRIYAIPAGSTNLTIATVAAAPNYGVSPNDQTLNLAPVAANTTNYAMDGIFQSVAYVSAVANTTYLIQVDGVASPNFPYLGQGNFTFQLTTGTISASAPTFQPQSGWWWSPNYPGAGFAIETRFTNVLLNPGALMAGMFIYDGAGNATWHIAQGQMVYNQGGGGGLVPISQPNYSSVSPNGTPINFLQYAGGSSLGSTSNSPIRPFGTPIPVIFRFFSGTTGQVEWPGLGTAIAIQRYPIPGVQPQLAIPATGTTTTTTTAQPPTTGWYWNPAEPGRGYFVEYQAGAMFLGSFLYRNTAAGGTPVWYAALGSFTPGTTLSTRLYEYNGGSNLGILQAVSSALPVTLTIDRGPFAATFAAPATAGASTSAGSAGSTVLGGVNEPLTRFTF